VAGKLPAPPRAIKDLLDTTLIIMKANAANRASVNWKAIEKQVWAQAAGVENPYQLGPLYRALFRSLNDFHGAVFIGDSMFKFQREEPEASDSIKNEWKKGVFVQTQMLKGNIGYLRVPYISFDERDKLDKKSQSLNDSLCTLLNRHVKGIVLDLRLNGGGAMYPMMLGLQQLLGEGDIGSFTGNEAQHWIIKSNGFYLDIQLLTAIIPSCSINNKNIPVVLLIGPGTGSSGEFLAISFKGRKNTLFIGSKSAGYVTSIKGFTINNAVSLRLSTGYGKDRAGKLYDTAIEPDIYMDTPDSFNDIQHDGKVLAAVKWINGL